MPDLPDRSTFEGAYAGKPPPWDIGRAQRRLADAAPLVASPVLDAGCGTGENALHLAARGHRVTGIDFVPEAIRQAQAKAAGRGVAADFLVMDALALGAWDRRFRTVVDSGLFHVFSDEERRRYAAGLARVLEPGGRLLLLCFSDEEPGSGGPRRVSRREIEDTFSGAFEVESVEPFRFEVNPEWAHLFPDGGPRAWFAVLRRRRPSALAAAPPPPYDPSP